MKIFMVYDTECNAWTILTFAPLPVPSCWSAMTLFEGQLMVFGGYRKRAEKLYNIVQIYNLSSKGWTKEVKRMPVALSHHSSCVVHVPKK